SIPGETELIVVNDGSSDDTGDKLKAAAALDSRVKAHGYPTNRGRGFAIRWGLQNSKGDIIVVTEGDLSYGDDIVSRLSTHLIDGDYDCVVASPHTSGGGMKNVPANRAFFTRVGNWILTKLMPVKLGTYTGMTRAYKRKMIQAVDLESNGKELHLEIISKLAALDYQIGELPAILQWPEGRKTRKGTFAPWRIIVSHLGFGFGEAPLLLLGTAGGLLILFGLLTGFYLLAVSLSGTAVGGRPLVVFSPSCILVGFFMLLIGWLAQQNKQLQRQLHRIQTQFGNFERRQNKDEQAT
ncbi:glycosyltransferase family 2 protein, partial [bacterium]|nr:glycosyltransferase family 2 protein [bacterium]